MGDGNEEWDTVTPALRRRRTTAGKVTEDHVFYSEAAQIEFVNAHLPFFTLRHRNVLALEKYSSWEAQRMWWVRIEYESFERCLEDAVWERVQAQQMWTESEIASLLRDLCEGVDTLKGDWDVDLNLRTVVCEEGKPFRLKDCLRKKGTLGGHFDPRYHPPPSQPSLSSDRAILYSLVLLSLHLLHPGLMHRSAISKNEVEKLCEGLGQELQHILSTMLTADGVSLKDVSERASSMLLSTESLAPPPTSPLCSYCCLRIPHLTPPLAPCPAHIFCSSECLRTASVAESAPPAQGSCPICLISALKKKKKLVVIKPKAGNTDQQPPVCLVCGKEFAYKADDMWRMQLIGSILAEPSKTICSEECFSAQRQHPKPSVQEDDEKAIILQQLAENEAKLAEATKRMEARRLQIEAIEQEMAALVVKNNGNQGCHFCHKAINNLLECRWIVCGGEMKALCCGGCVGETLGIGADTDICDRECPACGSQLEKRRILESLSFSSFSDYPEQYTTDCSQCFNPFDLQLRCGHGYCHSCYARCCILPGKKGHCEECEKSRS